jgi:hypothetical protein
MPHVDLTVEDNPRMQVESLAVEEGPIVTRSVLKRLRINQPQTTTMAQYYGPPEEQQTKKKNKKRLNST